MNPYSEDLRKKIVKALQRGMPRKIEAARTFGVGVSSLKRYVATYREGRSLAPSKRTGSKPKLDEGARRLLEVDLKELLYLPPSAAPPDLKPIEEVFANVKVVLRRAKARTREALIEAIGRSLDTPRASAMLRASSSIAGTALRLI